MELKLLDKISEGDAVCLLCKASLAQYVENLPDDFREYYIQRGIVTNRFLDNLWETISKKRHIPPIVLVAGPKPPVHNIGAVFNLVSGFKVLDGLQRSHRLKEIWDTLTYVNDEFVDNTNVPVARLTRQLASKLRASNISPQMFQKVLEAKRQGFKAKELFEDNNIWLEIWFGLSEAQQIQKMLILNAGHKSVNIKHQIELIFWSNYEFLESKLKPSTIVREKDKASTTYSKGRTPGEFHFAHLVSAFVSLAEGETVTTNAEFSASQSFSGDNSSDESLFDIDEHLLSAFAETLKLLDSALSSEAGIRWLGREVVLVGIFGAIGATAKNHPGGKIDALSNFNGRIREYVNILNLEGFEGWRNTLDLSKVNIGGVNKRAVFNATSAFLEGNISSQIDWRNAGVKDKLYDAS
jgi:hypothetical protein